MNLDEPNRESLQFWVETRLRDAVNDPERIQQALAMLKVACEHGDSPEVMMRKVLADFVFNAFGVDPLGGEGGKAGGDNGH